MSRIVSGLASILGRLARWFRLGPRAYAEPGTQQPARSHLRTTEQIIAELRSEGQLPTPEQGEIWSWSYYCYWLDTETGDRVGRGVPWTIDTPPNTDYRTVAAEARRRTMYPSDVTLAPPIPTSATVRLRCQRIGQPIIVTTS